MTMPLTKERLAEVEARIFTLSLMIQELTLRQGRYQQNQRYGALHPQVMQEMLAEQLKLNVERNVTEEYLERERQEAVTRSREASGES